MKFFLVLLSFLSLAQIANAQDFIKVTNLNANLLQGNGNGGTELFEIGSKSFSLKYKGEFDLSLDDSTLFLSFREVDLEVKNLPSFITKANKLVVKDLNVDYKKLNSGMIRFSEANIDSKIILNNIELSCGKIGRFRFENIVEVCSHAANIEGKKIILDGKNKFSNSSIKISNNKIQLSSNWQVGILSGKLRAIGETAYLKDKDILRVKINSAHLGIIPIKNTLFSILKKNESSKFKVIKPYLYVDLK